MASAAPSRADADVPAVSEREARQDESTWKPIDKLSPSIASLLTLGSRSGGRGS